MQVIHQASELKAGQKVCLAIGMFDGVHLGHRQLIRQTLFDARQHNGLAVAVTFDRHPAAVIAPERNPPLIQTLSQKLGAIAGLGADVVLLIAFTKEFSQQPGEVFIRRLVADFGQVHSICVGSTFTFGHKRTGNVALLNSLGNELHFIVHGLAAVSLDGKVVSSTRIRETIRSGDLDAASQMLGRTYAIRGPVIEGDHLGRKLGVPTANLDITGLVLPPHGVYAVHARLHGKYLPGVANLGLRPTLENPRPETRLEVHLLDFNQNIYGAELEISFLQHLRPEMKFESLESLRGQILADIQNARNVFE